MAHGDWPDWKDSGWNDPEWNDPWGPRRSEVSPATGVGRQQRSHPRLDGDRSLRLRKQRLREEGLREQGFREERLRGLVNRLVGAGRSAVQRPGRALTEQRAGRGEDPPVLALPAEQLRDSRQLGSGSRQGFPGS